MPSLSPSPRSRKSLLKTFIGSLAVCCLLAGCATSGNPRDPLEGFNRAMFDINDGIDKVFVKPLAEGYDAALPVPVRSGVSNFFGNIADLFIAVNNLLQGKLPEAASDVGRVAVNSTIGILGFIDFASDFGLEKHDEDFGQTFGRWGVGDGPYLVLPILGPRTLRDSVGLAIDLNVDPVVKNHNISTRNVMIATRALNDRADLLPADKIVDEAALDRYSFIRDAYLQRRRNLIYDGEPPRDNAADDLSFETLSQPSRLVRVEGTSNLYTEHPVYTNGHLLPAQAWLQSAR